MPIFTFHVDPHYCNIDRFSNNKKKIANRAKQHAGPPLAPLRLPHRNDAKSLFLRPPCYILAINFLTRNCLVIKL